MKLGGVDVAKVLANAMSPQLQGTEFDLTLVKVTAGTRTSNQPLAGTNPTTASYPCRGFFDERSSSGADGKKGRRLVILGGTLASGVVPVARDRVTVEGVTYTIGEEDGAVTSDPVKATFVCLVRASGA